MTEDDPSVISELSLMTSHMSLIDEPLIVDLYFLHNHQYTLVNEDVRLDFDDDVFRITDCATTTTLFETNAIQAFVSMLSYWIIVDTHRFQFCMSFEDIKSAKRFLDWWHLRRERFFGTSIVSVIK